MKDSPFQNVRAPRAPESLKQIVLDHCAEAFSRPAERKNIAWFDLFLQAAAAVSVVLFVVTCWGSFAVDNTSIASARFSRLDSPNVSVTSGKSSSLFVMRRTKTWF